MIKRKLLKKILITSTGLFALLLIYLIPKDNTLKNIPQNLEYITNITTNSIFLLDNDNYLAKATVPIENDKIEDKIKELVEILISGGNGENKIPNGFKSILSSETKILSINYDNGLIKINFSKDLLDIPKELEQKMIEAIVYTITSIPEVENIIIYVEGNILTKLPKTNINLPSTLNRNFGINKVFDFTNVNDINKITVYYINKHNDNYYYVPVTKYLNDSREKIRIIIDELSSTYSYNTNLMSFLNDKTELLETTITDDSLNLVFNSYIFEDIINKNILEEVIYTISLSIKDNYDVKEVIFNVGNEEIYKSVLKTLD